MTIVRWDPFRELVSVQDQVNRLFADVYGRRDASDVTPKGAWVPPVDIHHDAGQQALVVTAELPDVAREDIQISVDHQTLTLKGEKKVTRDVQGDHVHRQERTYGSFSRSFTLPPAVDASKASAEFRNGVLSLRLPIREEAKPRQIQVTVQ